MQKPNLVSKTKSLYVIAKESCANAFLKALVTGNLEEVKRYLKAIPKLAKRRYKRTIGGLEIQSPALFIALDYNSKKPQFEIIEALLNASAPIHLQDRWGDTPLTYFLRSPSTDTKLTIVKLLLDRGARSNAIGADYQSPLLKTVNDPADLPFVKLLLQKNADPNMAIEGGITPLIKAAEQGNVEAVRLLLSGSQEGPQMASIVRTEEIDRSYLGLLPEEIAQKVTRYDTKKIMKADPNIKDHDGKTALYYAEKQFNTNWPAGSKEEAKKPYWKEIIDLLKPITKK